MGRKIVISAICLITFRPRHDQLVPNPCRCVRFAVFIFHWAVVI